MLREICQDILGTLADNKVIFHSLNSKILLFMALIDSVCSTIITTKSNKVLIFGAVVICVDPGKFKFLSDVFKISKPL